VPKLDVLEDMSTDGIRTVKLHVSSVQNAHEISVLKDTDLEVIEYSVNSVTYRPLLGEEEDSSYFVLFYCRNVPAKTGIFNDEDKRRFLC
jgi:hypothetical protein